MYSVVDENTDIQDALLREKQSLNLLRQLVVQSTQGTISKRQCKFLFFSIIYAASQRLDPVKVPDPNPIILEPFSSIKKNFAF